ncbi:MAG TPA: glycosyltransferase family 4 protein [Chloroflexia bacterium]|nr:glycosyltransferase family 4 protein [Chloroflexia bacterium]
MSVNERANKVLFAHPGNPPFAQQAARALYEAGMLSAYVTSFAYRPKSRLGRGLKAGLGVVMADPAKELARRQIREVPDSAIVTHPVAELLCILSGRLGVGPIAGDLLWERAEKWFDSVVARHHASGVDAVYGYEHATLDTFRRMRREGRRCIYDQPICHHKTLSEILYEEYDRFPEVQTPYEAHIRRLAPRRNARKDEELAMADLVIAASGFTRDSLVRAGIAGERIKVVPYGSPPVSGEATRKEERPVIFLSAGQQSVRKGTHYLLDAWRKLRPGKEAELWLVGRMTLPPDLTRDLPGRVVIRAGLPHRQLFEVYRKASVLVFPSLCEGFGMVITEAMSQGLPVITTHNTAGPDLIKDYHNGFIVPVRDADALAEKMAWCLDNPRLVTEMGPAATQTAMKWQWSDYRAALAGTVSSFLSSGCRC